MSDAYLVAVQGLDELTDLSQLSAQVQRKAQQAVNTTARDTRAASAKEIREQVNFPARYLSGQSGRLAVTAKAKPQSLSATITGRDRPTSLARFATSRDPAASRRQGGVKVMVQPGNPQFMKGAFLMNLRGGNLGLAIRLKPGERIRNKKYVRQIDKGLYLLYGPAINQVFSTVAEDQSPDAAERLLREFNRLMDRT